jgi:regulator of sigma E protease
MAGEDGIDGEMKLPKNKYLCNKPWWQQLIVLVMGVVMNFITAIILLIILGMMTGASDLSTTVGSVVKDSPAQLIGITSGDKIVEFNGHKVSNWDQMSVYSEYKTKDKVRTYKIKHQDGTEQTYQITPAKFAVFGDKTVRIKDDYTVDDIARDYNVDVKDITETELVGINQSEERSYKFIDVVKYAIKKFIILFNTIWMILGALFTGKIGLTALSGPVGMYSVVGKAASYGIANLVYLTAYLSINLGVVNIFPFPAFDGGRVVFVLIETITKKKINPKVEGIVNTIGFALLMLLMLIVTGHDIFRLFK